MAVSKILETTTLSIEVEAERDKDGNPVYKKKTISGIRGNADLEKIAATADAISDVLRKNTRNYFLNETSKVLN